MQGVEKRSPREVVKVPVAAAHARRPTDTSVYPRVDRRGWKVPARERSTFRGSVCILALSCDRVGTPYSTGRRGATVAMRSRTFFGPIDCDGSLAALVAVSNKWRSQINRRDPRLLVRPCASTCVLQSV